VLCQKCLGVVLSVAEERSPVIVEELDREGRVVRRYTIYPCGGCREKILSDRGVREAAG
jgi:hypothetical protein